MPTDKSAIESQVRAAFIRQEQYSRKVKRLYDDYTDEILRLVNSFPAIDPGIPFSFKNYPVLQRRVNILLREMTGKVTAVIQKGIENEWETSNRVNDSMVRDLLGEKLSKDPRFERFFDRNLKARDAFKGRVDAGGMNLSRRIWVYTGIMKDELDAALEVALTEGKSAVEISREVRNYLREPDRLFRRVMDEKGILRLSKAAKAFHPGQGMYRSSFKNAMRVARTETNMAYKAADMARYQQLDFVVGYEVKLSKSHPIKMPNGDICDDLDGKYPKEFKFVGWHPQCLCYVTSILMTDEEFWQMQDKVIKGGSTEGMTSVNRVSDVPDGFKKWIVANKQRADGWKSQPYFIKENFKGGRIEGGLKIKIPEISPNDQTKYQYFSKDRYDEAIGILNESQKTNSRLFSSMDIYRNDIKSGQVIPLTELTEMENYLIYNYTGGAYRTLNQYLYKGKFPSQFYSESELLAWRDVMNESLIKIGIKSGNTIRATKIPMSGINEIEQCLKEGKFWQNKTVCSSSWNESEALLFRGEASKDEIGVIFRIKTKKGNNIKTISQNRREDECLFSSEHKWKIVKVQKVKNGKEYEIWMEDFI